MSSFEEEAEELRLWYVGLSSRQRLQIARHHLDYPEDGTSRLIRMLGAVEALARSICMDAIVAGGRTSREDAYERILRSDPVWLVDVVVWHHTKQRAERVLGSPTWEGFELAESYRSLLTHECMPLHASVCSRLIGSTAVVFELLARLAEDEQ